jgi:hypothetical protein
MTINGSKQYFFKGTWTSTVFAGSGSFGYDLTTDCIAAKA